MSKVYNMIGRDSSTHEFKLVMRYPLVGEYLPVPIEHDKSSNAICIFLLQNTDTAMDQRCMLIRILKSVMWWVV